MPLTWTHETPAKWDANKQRIVGDAPAGTFDSRYRTLKPGALVPGEWWRVADGGNVVGYGWLDVSFGDAEILLAVDPAQRKKGVGAFILERLDAVARARGLHYLCNLVRPTNPQAKEIALWLEKRGFVSQDDGRLVRPVKH